MKVRDNNNTFFFIHHRVSSPSRLSQVQAHLEDLWDWARRIRPHQRLLVLNLRGLEDKMRLGLTSPHTRDK